MDVTAVLVRGLVLFVALIGLLTLVAQRIDAKYTLRRLRKHHQPLRRITEAERQAVRAVFGLAVATDAPVYRVDGAARQRRVTMNGQEFVRGSDAGKRQAAGAEIHQSPFQHEARPSMSGHASIDEPCPISAHSTSLPGAYIKKAMPLSAVKIDM